MIKLFDSELHVMEQLWSEGDQTAKELAEKLQEQVGWSRTTTYTVIKKLVDKGAIERSEPNFMCHPLISKKDVQQAEVDELIDKVFDGSSGLLLHTLLEREDLPEGMTDELKKIVEEMK